MNPFKRAFLHVTRKKGKTLLLLCTLALIATCILSCFAIRHGAELAALNIRQSIQGGFTLSRTAESTDSIDDAFAGQIMHLPGLEHYNLRSEGYAEYKLPGGTPLEVVPGSLPDMEEGLQHVGTVHGTRFSDKHAYFDTLGFELAQGRSIGQSDEYAALVHENFARLNGLSLGDTIRLELNKTLTGDGTIHPEPVDVKIIGTFQTDSAEEASSFSTSITSYENMVFTDPVSFEKLYACFGKTGSQNADFTVNDPEEIPSIISSMKEINGVDWEAFETSINDRDYQQAMRPLQGLNGLLFWIMVIIAAASTGILTLILILHLKNRIHETGVLLSIGIGKGQIFLQHILELFMIALVAFGISYFASAAAAQTLGDTLLQQQASSSEEEEQEPALTEITVDIRPREILYVCAAGSLIALCSTGIALLPILRMKPGKILSAMS